MAAKDSNGITWFIVGAVVGTAIGLLYAPKEGKKTRETLSQKGGETAEALTVTGKDLMEKGKELYERGRVLADEAAELFDRGRKLVRG